MDELRQLLADRHVRDAIARAVVTGERGLGEAQDRIADDVASIMIDRLAAVGASGHGRVAHLAGNASERWQEVKERYGRELLDLLIRRTDKHLAHSAMRASLNGER